MAGRLLRVLVNRPGERFGAAHETEGAFYAEPVDLALAQAQHDALVTVLEDAGAQVERLGSEAGPDSIYTYDPALVVRRRRDPAALGQGDPAAGGAGDGRVVRAATASPCSRGSRSRSSPTAAICSGSTRTRS